MLTEMLSMDYELTQYELHANAPKSASCVITHPGNHKAKLMFMVCKKPTVSVIGESL